MEKDIKKKETQGAKANYNGKALEKEIEAEFIKYGLGIYTSRELSLLKQKNKFVPTDYYVEKNAPYISIYDTDSRSEFRVTINGVRTRIEAKYQSSKGSVDEKITYVLLNAILSYPEENFILVMEGEGFKKGVRGFVRKFIDFINENPVFFGNKHITLMDKAEIFEWIRINAQTYDRGIAS